MAPRLLESYSQTTFEGVAAQQLIRFLFNWSKETEPESPPEFEKAPRTTIREWKPHYTVDSRYASGLGCSYLSRITSPCPPAIAEDPMKMLARIILGSVRAHASPATIVVTLTTLFSGAGCGPPENLSREERQAAVERAAEQISKESCRHGNRIGCPDTTGIDSINSR